MELDDLYQEIIFDHYKQPRNQGDLQDANLNIEGKNPFCGDQVSLSLNIHDNIISDVKFHGSGCAISQASISMMTEKIKNKSVTEAKELIDQFSRMVKGSDKIDPETIEELDELAAFQGICEYPTRVKCAMLGWNTLKKAIESTQEKEDENA